MLLASAGDSKLDSDIPIIFDGTFKDGEKIEGTLLFKDGTKY